MKEEKKEIAISKPQEFDLLITKAIDKNVPVETMEKLLAMRDHLKQEQAKEQYNIALSEFQAECPPIAKNKKVFEKNSTTQVRYKYAPLDEIVEQVKPLLKKYGFSYTFNAKYEERTTGDGRVIGSAQVITCTARHIGGWSETAEFRAPVDVTAYMSDVQKQGSAMTFAKRYAFCEVFGIMTGDEDNDGIDDNKKEQNNKQPGTPPAQKPASTTTPKSAKTQPHRSGAQVQTDDVPMTDEQKDYYDKMIKSHLLILNNWVEKYHDEVKQVMKYIKEARVNDPLVKLDKNSRISKTTAAHLYDWWWDKDSGMRLQLETLYNEDGNKNIVAQTFIMSKEQTNRHKVKCTQILNSMGCNFDATLDSFFHGKEWEFLSDQDKLRFISYCNDKEKELSK